MKRQYLVYIMCLFVVSCTSPAPKTQHYVLHSRHAGTSSHIDDTAILGVGPIKVAEYLSRNSIAAFSGTNEVIYASGHAWSGNLKNMLLRVYSENIRNQISSGDVIPFPWTVSERPAYQLKLNVIDFSGRLGKNAEIKLNWKLIYLKTGRVVQKGQIVRTQKVSGGSYTDYVTSLNQLVDDSASELSGLVTQLMAAQ